MLEFLFNLSALKHCPNFDEISEIDIEEKEEEKIEIDETEKKVEEPECEI